MALVEACCASVRIGKSDDICEPCVAPSRALCRQPVGNGQKNFGAKMQEYGGQVGHKRPAAK
jgi:hypothetical protein